MITVASWPGYGPTQNSFLRIFLDGLSSTDCRVVSLAGIEDFKELGAVDVTLLHWPQRVFWEAETRAEVPVNIFRFLKNLRARPRTNKLVWLAHDLRPHDAQGLQKMLWSPLMAVLSREIDGVATLSAGTLQMVHDHYPSLAKKPSIALRHPAYPDQALDEAEVMKLREAAGYEPDNRVIGYCGQLRHNKGLDVLAQAFGELSAPEARLHIAGSPAGPAAVVDELRSFARNDGRVRLTIGDLDDEAFRSALAVCDVIAAPFRNYLHSGSLIHSLSANRPVLTPTTAFSTDLKSDLGSEWVSTYDGELQPSHLRDSLDRPRPSGDALTANFDASQIGRTFAAWLRSLDARQS